MNQKETLGFKVFYYTLILVLICCGPVGWAILICLWDSDSNHPGQPGNPWHPTPQPVYWERPVGRP